MSNGVDALVSEALKAIERDPARAATLCRTALQANPNSGDARLVLSEALRRTGSLEEAQALAAADVQARPNWFGAHRQLGVILADRKQHLPAATALRRAGELNPAHPTIWRDVAEQLQLAGDIKGAQAMYAHYGLTSPGDPRLARAAELMGGELRDVEGAEKLILAVLSQHPDDVVALRALAEAHGRAGRSDKAEETLRRALEIAPDFGYARHSLGQLLMGLARLEDAQREVQRLLLQDPRNTGSRRLQAALLNTLGEHDEAIAVYEGLLKDAPDHAGTWMSIGHVLKTVDRTDEAIEAYRKSIAIEPGMGVSYWSLANLKSVRFSAAEVAQMEAQLQRGKLDATDRINMLYALGKAYEDAKQSAEAFKAYAEGAALYRASVQYDPTEVPAFVALSQKLLTKQFFAERVGAGCEAQDPIFIVGLPRAGSTLIEQILASHSMVEGTMELGDLNAIAATMEDGPNSYLNALPGLDAGTRRALGETYLRTTRVQRKLGRPLFINKMPNDFRHIGLIQLILPNAKIIDARRNPMACGWSCFKQHFAMGQLYTYDLAELGAYYAEYVKLMAHYDAVLPGRVHRVIHEELVTDPEPHIRALLEYCGLPFEDAVLRPHETKRAVRTASSEQVRKPISAAGLNDWRPYEPFLGPLKQALGPVLDAYPGVPSSFS